MRIRYHRSNPLIYQLFLDGLCERAEPNEGGGGIGRRIVRHEESSELMQKWLHSRGHVVPDENL